MLGNQPPHPSHSLHWSYNEVSLELLLDVLGVACIPAFLDSWDFVLASIWAWAAWDSVFASIWAWAAWAFVLASIWDFSASFSVSAKTYAFTWSLSAK